MNEHNDNNIDKATSTPVIMQGIRNLANKVLGKDQEQHQHQHQQQSEEEQDVELEQQQQGRGRGGGRGGKEQSHRMLLLNLSSEDASFTRDEDYMSELAYAYNEKEVFTKYTRCLGDWAYAYNEKEKNKCLGDWAYAYNEKEVFTKYTRCLGLLFRTWCMERIYLDSQARLHKTLVYVGWAMTIFVTFLLGFSSLISKYAYDGKASIDQYIYQADGKDNLYFFKYKFPIFVLLSLLGCFVHW